MRVVDQADRGLFPRFAAEIVTTALQDTPVVMVIGPRQCGKSGTNPEVSPEDFQDLRDTLMEDLDIAELHLSHARAEEIEIEQVLDFAENLQLDTAGAWQRSSLEQKQRPIPKESRVRRELLSNSRNKVSIQRDWAKLTP